MRLSKSTIILDKRLVFIGRPYKIIRCEVYMTGFHESRTTKKSYSSSTILLQRREPGKYKNDTVLKLESEICIKDMYYELKLLR